MSALIEGPATISVFGGVYNNHHALRSTIADAHARGARELYCLGDLGGFGPHPDRVFPLLREAGVIVLQGNYDHSIGYDLVDCGCGYTDPRDNYYAQLSYDYTRQKTAAEHHPYLRALPPSIRRVWAGERIAMAHGSPRKVNEFLWESTSPEPFLERLMDDIVADVLFVTHSGIQWQRRLPSGRLVVNVGAIGRPANDGKLCVWSSIVHVPIRGAGRIEVELVPISYDHAALAAEMRVEGICEEFVETVETGWWTTCLEILPAKERARGRY